MFGRLVAPMRAVQEPPRASKRVTSERSGFARILRFSSVIKGAEKTDQQHRDEDLEFHVHNLETGLGVRLTIGQQETFQWLNLRNLSNTFWRSMCPHG